MAIHTLSDWNRRQAHVFRRYGSIHRVPLTIELIHVLARRYAQRHARDRTYAMARGTLAVVGRARR